MNPNQKTSAPVVETLTEHLPPANVDVASGTVTYYGYAPIQTAEGDEGWRIVKKLVTGSVTTYSYPNADMGFKFSWTNRASYIYGR